MKQKNYMCIEHKLKRTPHNTPIQVPPTRLKYHYTAPPIELPHYLYIYLLTARWGTKIDAKTSLSTLPIQVPPTYGLTCEIKCEVGTEIGA